MKLGVNIPQSQIDALEARALHLTQEIDRATLESHSREIRARGAQLVDRVLEWVEEIKDVRDIDAEEAVDIMRSFSARLRMAERAVARWPRAKSAQASTRNRRRKHAA